MGGGEMRVWLVVVAEGMVGVGVALMGWVVWCGVVWRTTLGDIR